MTLERSHIVVGREQFEGLANVILQNKRISEKVLILNLFNFFFPSYTIENKCLLQKDFNIVSSEKFTPQIIKIVCILFQKLHYSTSSFINELIFRNIYNF